MREAVETCSLVLFSFLWIPVVTPVVTQVFFLHPKSPGPLTREKPYGTGQRKLPGRGNDF